MWYLDLDLLKLYTNVHIVSSTLDYCNFIFNYMISRISQSFSVYAIVWQVLLPGLLVSLTQSRFSNGFSASRRRRFLRLWLLNLLIKLTHGLHPTRSKWKMFSANHTISPIWDVPVLKCLLPKTPSENPPIHPDHILHFLSRSWHFPAFWFFDPQNTPRIFN